MSAETQTTTTIAVRPKSAKKDPKSDPTFFPQLMWATAILSGILLIAAGVIALFKRWRKRQTNLTESNLDQLTSFRSLYESGELSQEEYDKIRARIVKRMSKQMQPAPPPTAPPASPAQEPPPETRITDQPPT